MNLLGTKPQASQHSAQIPKRDALKNLPRNNQRNNRAPNLRDVLERNGIHRVRHTPGRADRRDRVASLTHEPGADGAEDGVPVDVCFWRVRGQGVEEAAGHEEEDAAREIQDVVPEDAGQEGAGGHVGDDEEDDKRQ